MTDPEHPEPLLAVRAVRTALACLSGVAIMLSINGVSERAPVTVVLALVVGLLMLGAASWLSRLTPDTLLKAELDPVSLHRPQT